MANRPTAYARLTKEMIEAEELLDAGVHNEAALREAFTAAEDLMLELDDAEAQLLAEIERAEEGPDE
jgi:Xaa-Pro aminopeptidase